jgi:hypothetical protein
MCTYMNYSRLHKIVFIALLVTLAIAFPFAINLDGSGDFFSSLIFISLSLYLPIYCLAAYKIGEIELRGPIVKRSESPFYYWLIMYLYLLFSTAFLFVILSRWYT